MNFFIAFLGIFSGIDIWDLFIVWKFPGVFLGILYTDIHFMVGGMLEYNVLLLDSMQTYILPVAGSRWQKLWMKVHLR